MTDRLHELERFIEELSRRLAHAESRLAAAEQNVSKLWNGMGGGSGGGGGTFYFVVSPGFSAATGTSPTLSPDIKTNQTVYKDVSGTQTQHLTGQTVRWWFKDAGAAGKLVVVAPSADGVGWDALLDSCTRIDV